MAGSAPRKISMDFLSEEYLQKNHGVTCEEVAFMSAVVKAVNRDLPKYDLLDSMRCIRERYTIDQEKLIEKGYVRKHCGVQRREYWTVLPAGQDILTGSVKSGPGIGDIAASTPHRVGVRLVERAFDGQMDCRGVLINSHVASGAVVDAIALDNDNQHLATVEVEAGVITADPGADADTRPGINDYKSIRKDYDALAELPGESLWVTRNHEITGNVLRALRSGFYPRIYISDDVIRDVEERRLRGKDLNDILRNLDNTPGLDRILTYRMMTDRLGHR